MVIGYSGGSSNGVPLTVESGETTEATTVSTPTTAPTAVGSIGGGGVDPSYRVVSDLISGLVAVIVFAIVLRCLSLFVDVVGKTFK